MARDQDIAAVEPLTDPNSGLAGFHPAKEELSPPVSPFTSAAHRLANETGTDERALRQMQAEEQEKERTRGS
jgi:hypothetical protein